MFLSCVCLQSELFFSYFFLSCCNLSQHCLGFSAQACLQSLSIYRLTYFCPVFVCKICQFCLTCSGLFLQTISNMSSNICSVEICINYVSLVSVLFYQFCFEFVCNIVCFLQYNLCQFCLIFFCPVFVCNTVFMTYDNAASPFSVCNTVCKTYVNSVSPILTGFAI